MKYLFALVSLISLKTFSQVPSHGAYGLFPQGSIRVIGMGGAFAALSDDASGMLFNPAGLPHSEWKYDFGASSSRINNEEGSTDFTLNQDYNAQFYAAAAKFGKNIVLAAGLSSPFELKENSDAIDKELVLISADLALAFKMGKFSFGVTGHYEQASLKFRNDNFNTPLAEQENTVFYPTIGLSYRGNRAGIGVSHTLERVHDIDESVNSSNSQSFWFRDVEIPSKTTIGVYYQTNKKVLLVLDLDIVDAPENSFLAGSGTDGANTGLLLLEKQQIVIHGGLEYLFLSNRKTEVRMQAGGYQEPARFAGGESRNHLTLGLEVRFGPLQLGVSYDQARDFQNTAASFSLSLGHI